MADLGIKIITTFDDKGVKSAQKSIGGISATAKKIAKSLRNAFTRPFRVLSDNAGKAAKSLKNTFDKLGQATLTFIPTTPADAIVKLAQVSTDLAVSSFKAAEEAKTATSAFTNLSGSANIASINLQAMDRATRGLISDTEQMKIANQLLGMNIVQTSSQLEEVVGVSRRLGKEFRGLGAREAAEEFAIMIANMSVARLDSFGLSSGRVRNRIQELQATTEGMTREQAFFQATMEEGQKTIERLGPEINTTSDEIARLKAEFGNLQVSIGQAAEETGVMQKFFKTLTGDLILFRDLLGDDTPEVRIKALNVELEREQARLEMLTERGEIFFGIFAKGAISAEENIARINAELARLANAQEVTTRAAENEQAALQARIRSEELAAESIAKRAEAEKKLLVIQKQFARDVVGIQAEAADQLEESQDQFDDDSEKAAKDHVDRLEDIGEKFAKGEVKAAKKLQKDLSKVDSNLKKQLIKQQANENKAVEKAQKNFAKEDRNTQRRKQIDTLADERLFQFELRNLAADGQGIAIKQALERRAIEEQIASEKAEFEKDVESDKRKDTVNSIRQEGQERRSELQQQATERKTDLQERNKEVSESRTERLAEQLADENESFSKRKLALQEALTERDEKIRESEIKRVEEIARGLAQVEGLTEGSLDRMISLAKQFGPQFGQAFADGMAKGFEETNVIESALAGAIEDFGAGAGTLPGGPTTPSANGQSPRLGGVSQFQEGGFIRNTGIGVLHQGEVVANPSEGQAIVINGEEFAVFEAERLGAAINSTLQRAFQSYTDTIAQALQ